MAHVVDVRSSGGEFAILGNALILPTHTPISTDPGPTGAIWYNPASGNIEANLGDVGTVSLGGTSGGLASGAILTSTQGILGIRFLSDLDTGIGYDTDGLAVVRDGQSVAVFGSETRVFNGLDLLNAPFLRLPIRSNAAPQAGMLRYNEQTNVIEFYNGSAWGQVTGGSSNNNPTLSVRSNGNTLSTVQSLNFIGDPVTVSNGVAAVELGPNLSIVQGAINNTVQTIVLTGDAVGAVNMVNGVPTINVQVVGNTDVTESNSGTFTGSFIGNLTGNVTGNVAGNASTATSLKDPFTISISGVINGSAMTTGASNLTIPVALTPGGINTGALADGAVSTAKLVDNAVTAAKIADGSVTALKITSGAVTTAKISASAVDATKLATGSVITEKIADAAITTAKIADGSVTAAKFADGTITSAKIASGAITTGLIADGAVGTVDIADSAITSAKIATGAITATKIADNAVTALAIADLTITGAKIADGAITATKLGALAVASANIADGAIVTAKLSDNSVTSAKIVDGAVGSVEITNAAVTSAKIATGAVTVDHLAANSVGSTQLTSSAVTTAKIALNAVTSGLIADGAVTSTKIATNSVSTANILDGSVTSAKIASGGVTTPVIADAAVTGPKIASGAVGTTVVADGAITTAKIATGAVNTGLLAANAVTSEKIADGTVTARNMALSDTSNILPDNALEDFSKSWTTEVSTEATASRVSGGGQINAKWAISMTGGTDTNNNSVLVACTSRPFPVVGGNAYEVSWKATLNSGFSGTHGISINWLNASGGLISSDYKSSDVSVIGSSLFSRNSLAVSAPVSAATAYVRVVRGVSAAGGIASGNTYAWDVEVRKAFAVTAGSITAEMFSPDAIFTANLLMMARTPDWSIDYIANGVFNKADYPGMKYIIVETTGGGGAGGGGSPGLSAQSAMVTGGGGGGGGYALRRLLASQVPETVAVTVGAGGAGSNSNVDGANGGTSSFGSLCSAAGGEGGGRISSSSATARRGDRGLGITGDILIPGYNAIAGGATNVSEGGWGAPTGTTETAYGLAKSLMGTSYVGGFGMALPGGTNNQDGVNGQIPGGGGSGGRANQTAQFGGSGGRGLVRVRVYK